jgi:UbiD family decarboxylase
MKGADVDVLEFLVPLIHGGRWRALYWRMPHRHHNDPDSSRVNWGMYRLMVHDRDTLGCLFPLQ